MNSLLQNWQINHTNNLLLLEHITEEQMTLKIGKKRSISDIFHHLVKNKFSWLPHIKPVVEEKTGDIEELELMDSEIVAFNWVNKLIKAQENGNKITGFKSDLVGFVIYLISHDSHHRGQILQILTTQGIKLEPSIQYGIWDWKY